MRFLSYFLKSVFIIIIFLILVPKFSYAKIRFTLQAPTKELTRGQTVTFLINVDTQGASLSSTAIAADYETQYLQFEQAMPGNTFSVIKSSPLSEGLVLIEGSSDPAFSGQGVFAYLNFKLIAQAPGETELCVLSNPASTAITLTPATAISPPTPTAIVTTNLPKTGSAKTGNIAKFFGITFITVALTALTLKRLNRFNK